MLPRQQQREEERKGYVASGGVQCSAVRCACVRGCVRCSDRTFPFLSFRPHSSTSSCAAAVLRGFFSLLFNPYSIIYTCVSIFLTRARARGQLPGLSSPSLRENDEDEEEDKEAGDGEDAIAALTRAAQAAKAKAEEQRAALEAAEEVRKRANLLASLKQVFKTRVTAATSVAEKDADRDGGGGGGGGNKAKKGAAAATAKKRHRKGQQSRADRPPRPRALSFGSALQLVAAGALSVIPFSDLKSEHDKWRAREEARKREQEEAERERKHFVQQLVEGNDQGSFMNLIKQVGR